MHLKKMPQMSKVCAKNTERIIRKFEMKMVLRCFKKITTSSALSLTVLFYSVLFVVWCYLYIKKCDKKEQVYLKCLSCSLHFKLGVFCNQMLFYKILLLNLYYSPRTGVNKHLLSGLFRFIC